jgi:L-aspartate oxidase
MRQNAGIVRRDEDLIKANEQLVIWEKEIENFCENYQITKDLYELKNMITVGQLIVQQSIDRKDNRGGFVKLN